MVVGKFGRSDPCDGLAMDGARLMTDPEATKESQMHGPFGVVVDDVVDERINPHFDAEFLAQFAMEALLKRFACLEFAARKFPKPAQVRLGGPLRYQQGSVSENQRGGNLDGNWPVHAFPRPMLL